MEDIAADEAEGAFEIERRKNLARQHGPPEVRRIGVDRIDHEIGDGFAMVVP